MADNTKGKFLKAIYEAAVEFEQKTGVEVVSINFIRVGLQEPGDFGAVSRIRAIELQAQ